jgi:integrase
MDLREALIKTSTIMKTKEFSMDVQKIYLDIISQYLKSLQFKSVIVGDESAKAYLLRLKQLGKDSRLIDIYTECIDFFLKNVLVVESVNSETLEPSLEIVKLKKEKKEKKIPLVLSVKEVLSILECIRNPSHNLIISFIYSTGIRLSELINLKRCDIDFDNNRVIIKSKSGKKDRTTLLSKKIKYRLIDYISENEFKTKYLFETNRSTKYSKGGVQKIVRENSKFTKKNVSPQTFRHSFAVHLIESGIDVHYVRKLLGHSKLETTMIYMKLIDCEVLDNIVSPFDVL